MFLGSKIIHKIFYKIFVFGKVTFALRNREYAAVITVIGARDSPRRGYTIEKTI